MMNFNILAGADDWSYSYGDHLGPGRWAAKYEQCAGQSQSPIAIWPNDLDIKTYSDKKLSLIHI